MTEPNDFPPAPPNPDLPPAGETPFIDRYHIHPLLFAFGSLFLIFILYQVVGAALTLIIAGTPEVTPENAPTVRWLVVCGQVLFIFIPTLFLARLGFSHPGDVFRFRTPGIIELALAFVALFSLQEVFTSYQFFQDKLPLPDSVHRILDPLKKILEDVTANLLHASSTAELVAVIIVVAVVPAIVEEMLFRGLIKKTFERILSPAVAAHLTGVISIRLRSFRSSDSGYFLQSCGTGRRRCFFRWRRTFSIIFSPLLPCITAFATAPLP